MDIAATLRTATKSDSGRHWAAGTVITVLAGMVMTPMWFDFFLLMGFALMLAVIMAIGAALTIVAAAFAGHCNGHSGKSTALITVCLLGLAVAQIGGRWQHEDHRVEKDEHAARQAATDVAQAELTRLTAQRDAAIDRKAKALTAATEAYNTAAQKADDMQYDVKLVDGIERRVLIRIPRVRDLAAKKSAEARAAYDAEVARIERDYAVPAAPVAPALVIEPVKPFRYVSVFAPAAVELFFAFLFELLAGKLGSAVYAARRRREQEAADRKAAAEHKRKQRIAERKARAEARRAAAEAKAQAEAEAAAEAQRKADELFKKRSRAAKKGARTKAARKAAEAKAKVIDLTARRPRPDSAV